VSLNARRNDQRSEARPVRRARRPAPRRGNDGRPLQSSRHCHRRPLRRLQSAPSGPLVIGRVPGQGKEHVVERRPPQCETEGLHARGVSAAPLDSADFRAAAADPDAEHGGGLSAVRDHQAPSWHWGRTAIDDRPRSGTVNSTTSPAGPGPSAPPPCRRDDQAVVETTIRSTVSASSRYFAWQQQRGPVRASERMMSRQSQPRRGSRTVWAREENSTFGRPNTGWLARSRRSLHAAGISRGSRSARVAAAPN